MDKIKSFIGSDKGKDILVVIIVILVGLGSFGIGRLSNRGPNSHSGIEIEYPSSNTQKILSGAVISTLSVPVTNSAPKPSEKAFFASKRGSKYYPASCSAGKNIKQENRIYFSIREDAEAAGFELSKSCR